MTSSMTTSGSSLASMLDLVELKPGVKFSRSVLTALLPDAETTLFFGKVYGLDYQQLSRLLAVTVRSDLANVLFAEGELHSSDLQDYIVEICDLEGVVYDGAHFDTSVVPSGEILPEVWKSMQTDIADSIKAVADKLKDVVGHMPGKQGEMVFRSLMRMNVRRPVIGDYVAGIHHAPAKENLVIFDVSGSMSESTVRALVDDVVAMSYVANAHMAIVSSTCTYWMPGAYGVEDILQHAEFGGTQYEELAPLFDRDWGVVVCVADYDSSQSAKRVLAQCKGRIDQVLDISLVNRPTFLSECVGQLADEVRPLLVSNSRYVLAV